MKGSFYIMFRTKFNLMFVFVGVFMANMPAFAINCDSGQYLKKSKTSCDPCPSNEGKYCPGGTYETNTDADQGIFDCPAGTSTNSDRSGCKVSVSQRKMKYGPTNNSVLDNQCWTKTQIHDYANCVFPNGKFGGIIRISYKEAEQHVAQQQVEK